jgi:hypothetical protein
MVKSRNSAKMKRQHVSLHALILLRTVFLTPSESCWRTTDPGKRWAIVWALQDVSIQRIWLRELPYFRSGVTGSRELPITSRGWDVWPSIGPMLWLERLMCKEGQRCTTFEWPFRSDWPISTMHTNFGPCTTHPSTLPFQLFHISLIMLLRSTSYIISVSGKDRNARDPSVE